METKEQVKVGNENVNYFFKNEGKNCGIYYRFNLPRNKYDDYFNYRNNLNIGNSYVSIKENAEKLGIKFEFKGYKTHAKITVGDFVFHCDNFEAMIVESIIALHFCKIIN